MKNIHVLQTDKPSRLIMYSKLLGTFRLLDEPCNDWKGRLNIYITNDEEIKEGDWFLCLDNGKCYDSIYKANEAWLNMEEKQPSYCKKIILTTDQDLINDGVQEIDDEFLQWFVENPSCERVDVRHLLKSIFDPKTNEKHPVVQYRHFDLAKMICEYKYEIIIPKEEQKQTDENGKPLTYWGGLAEHKQETLEEAAEKHVEINVAKNAAKLMYKEHFIAGAQWQQDQDKKKYSEEDMIEAAKYGYNFHKTTSFPNQEFEASCIRNTQQWLTTYKKK